VISDYNKVQGGKGNKEEGMFLSKFEEEKVDATDAKGIRPLNAMPPRRSKAKKNVDPRPRRSTRGARAAENATVEADSEETPSASVAREETTDETATLRATPSIPAHDVPPTVAPEAEQPPGTIGGSLTKETLSPADRDEDVQMDTGTLPDITTTPESEKPGSGLTLEERKSKLDELRLKMVRLCSI
jgi:hypothetical protein